MNTGVGRHHHYDFMNVGFSYWVSEATHTTVWYESFRLIQKTAEPRNLNPHKYDYFKLEQNYRAANIEYRIQCQNALRLSFFFHSRTSANAFNFTSEGRTVFFFSFSILFRVHQRASWFFYYWEMKWEHIYSSLVFNPHSHSYCSCLLIFLEPTIQHTFCSNDINNCHLKKRWIGWFVQIRAFSEMSVCYLLLLFPQINTLCMFVGFNNNFFVPNQQSGCGQSHYIEYTRRIWISIILISFMALDWEGELRIMSAISDVCRFWFQLIPVPMNRKFNVQIDAIN